MFLFHLAIWPLYPSCGLGAGLRPARRQNHLAAHLADLW
jgi:hypothetical protein